MRRAATPIFRTVVPAITQVPASFGDVALQAKSAIQQSWEELNNEHQIISPGSFFSSSPPPPPTTTTTTTTTTSFDFSEINNTTAIVQRVDNVFASLSVDNTHPTSAALAQVVKDTASDEQIVQKIIGFDSFRRFANSFPPNLNTVSSSVANMRFANLEANETSTMGTSTGTQTDDAEFINSLEMITEQLELDLGILPPTADVDPSPSSSTPSSNSLSSTSASPPFSSPITATPVILSATASTSVSGVPGVSAPSVAYESSEPIHTPAPAVGDAGMPGNTTTNMSKAVRVILPLTIFAIAAAAILPTRTAADLLTAGIKFVTRLLVKQPL